MFCICGFTILNSFIKIFICFCSKLTYTFFENICLLFKNVWWARYCWLNLIYHLIFEFYKNYRVNKILTNAMQHVPIVHFDSLTESSKVYRFFPATHSQILLVIYTVVVGRATNLCPFKHNLCIFVPRYLTYQVHKPWNWRLGVKPNWRRAVRVNAGVTTLIFFSGRLDSFLYRLQDRLKILFLLRRCFKSRLFSKTT